MLILAAAVVLFSLIAYFRRHPGRTERFSENLKPLGGQGQSSSSRKGILKKPSSVGAAVGVQEQFEGFANMAPYPNESSQTEMNLTYSHWPSKSKGRLVF